MAHVDWRGKLKIGDSLECNGSVHTLLEIRYDGGLWKVKSGNRITTIFAGFLFHTGWQLSKSGNFNSLYDKLCSRE